MALEKEAVVSALVRGAGIVGSAEKGRATVLIYLDQILAASNTKEATDPIGVGKYRVLVALHLVDGEWLVDDIDPF
jgi:hypothetical protein